MFIPPTVFDAGAGGCSPMTLIFSSLRDRNEEKQAGYRIATGDERTHTTRDEFDCYSGDGQLPS
jgi:hypothetical protein